MSAPALGGPSPRPQLLILVKNAATGEFDRVTGEEALFLETLWDSTPDGEQITTAGVGTLRMRLGWSRQRFDRVRYALHTATYHRGELLHELHREEYRTSGGEIRAGKQPFILHPLVRTARAQTDEERTEA